ncbi:MAG: hypothetical protein PHR26_00280 [Candidatus ainarchaeum sp.]|nr:hypothetical protein [Candidatus ainarchaeum sp.]MDD3975651.1 hypothetical protein [Candidatus ainarchaeum sp.]
MSLSDSVLLQVNQKKTTYNDLLTKIIPNYSNVASAKAALSRSLKNLITFGQLIKKDDFYLLTDKGKNTVESKFKNKILISINDLLNKSRNTNSLEFVDNIVKNLQIFIERSKSDFSLLKIGKTGSTFYISDLDFLRKELENSVSHYNHILEVLKSQISILQDLDFEDFLIINFDKGSFKNIKSFCIKNNVSEINLEIYKNYPETENLFNSFKKFTKKSDNVYILQTKDILSLEKLLLDNFDIALQVRFKIYLNEFLLKYSFGKMYIFGPYNLLNNLKNKTVKIDEEVNL